MHTLPHNSGVISFHSERNESFMIHQQVKSESQRLLLLAVNVIVCSLTSSLFFTCNGMRYWPLFSSQWQTQPVEDNLLFVRKPHMMVLPRVASDFYFIRPRQRGVLQFPIDSCQPQRQQKVNKSICTYSGDILTERHKIHNSNHGKFWLSSVPVSVAQLENLRHPGRFKDQNWLWSSCHASCVAALFGGPEAEGHPGNKEATCRQGALKGVAASSVDEDGTTERGWSPSEREMSWIPKSDSFFFSSEEWPPDQSGRLNFIHYRSPISPLHLKSQLSLTILVLQIS